MGVFIDVLAHEPRRRKRRFDAELFMQLAYQRRARRFARLDLAAGKFPVAGIERLRGALAEQKASVRPQDHGGGDLGDVHYSILPA
jgi:hypothetical protein